MTAYYNEFDPFAAQWLRNLIAAGHIAPGVVDDRSITDVTASDLKGFTQCHFFAGIGGWSLALRLAGVPDTFSCWTGSPPCQPFSAAGKQLGQLDARHLAPTFLRLVAECRPSVLFGEQVAPAIAKHWLDDLFTELEAETYACGAAVLPACSVGAPHKRDRLFFGAALLEHAGSFGRESWGIGHNAGYDGQQPVTACKNSRMADNWMQQRQSTMPGSRTEGLEPRGWDEATAETAGCGRRCSVAYCDSKQCNGTGKSGASGERKSADCGSGCGLAYLDGKRSQGQRAECASQGRKEQDVRQAGLCDRAGADAARQVAGFWSGADWLLCRDGKFRPVESGTFPLVNGFPGRVGRLRGYGNAIVPQVAAEFIISFLAAMSEVAQ
ncbi:DNA cytosine methyltransferase [Pantoea piersonii]|uniref:DNA cytosine methyltransferase n=1 Tax=Pantoea piersonii TaxID=2364647 RepID=UPI0022F1D409|nr:DNA cytosine methyltransferase [Pantoea piersonii]WBV22076.1 DNA cytosine methyltransferase [Pantoea piersonii]